MKQCFVVVVLALAFSRCATVETPAGRCARASVAAWPVEHTRLIAAETVEEAERRHVVNGVPFGGANARWQELLDQLAPGDQLWRFGRPRRPGLYGALEGYIVLRGCEAVNQLVLVWD
jgi:hypothetical protein